MDTSTAAAERGLHVLPGGNRNPAEETLREREFWFAALLAALPTAVYTTDAAGRITYYNEAAAELWGYRPTLGTSEWCGSWKLYWPDGTPLPHDQCPMALALKENRPIRGVEAIAERPDGVRVPFIPYPTPLHDASGRLLGAVNMLIDISDRKRAEERQSLLIRELHHRVKNTLATVQAIMSSTARHCSTIDEFQQAFVGRIAAMSRTHTMLTEAARQTVAFHELLRGELEPFNEDGGKRVVLNGPALELTSEMAVPVAMALHELTTNAIKYGALSAPGGTIEVTWSLSVTADGNVLNFEWIERGGPAVAPPARQGFGSRLLQHALSSQANAQTVLAFEPDGLRARIDIALPRHSVRLS